MSAELLLGLWGTIDGVIIGNPRLANPTWVPLNHGGSQLANWATAITGVPEALTSTACLV